MKKPQFLNLRKVVLLQRETEARINKWNHKKSKGFHTGKKLPPKKGNLEVGRRD